MYAGKQLLIATKHQKEKIIAPIFEKELGVSCFIPANYDTDKFGTFTGEIERLHDPITTVKTKCLMAMETANCQLAVASEGSFGPHPSMHFVPANEEFLIFIDKEKDLEIMVRELSTETNFNAAEIKSIEELKKFAQRAEFPSHGLIIRNQMDENSPFIKGINDWNSLVEEYSKIFKKTGVVYVETDMRAMYNPTRMQVIQKAAQKLVDKINSACPKCSTPGFGITDVEPGLPCELCGSPTRSTLNYIYTCKKCDFFRKEHLPENKMTEDPMYCDQCNP